jgi:hypothetical protein
MLPTTGSTMTAAMSAPCSAKTCSSAAVSLKGAVMVFAATEAVTPGLSGRPRVATPEPALTSRLSPWPW